MERTCEEATLEQQKKSSQHKRLNLELLQIPPDYVDPSKDTDVVEKGPNTFANKPAKFHEKRSAIVRRGSLTPNTCMAPHCNRLRYSILGSPKSAAGLGSPQMKFCSSHYRRNSLTGATNLISLSSLEKKQTSSSTPKITNLSNPFTFPSPVEQIEQERGQFLGSDFKLGKSAEQLNFEKRKDKKETENFLVHLRKMPMTSNEVPMSPNSKQYGDVLLSLSDSLSASKKFSQEDDSKNIRNNPDNCKREIKNDNSISSLKRKVINITGNISSFQALDKSFPKKAKINDETDNQINNLDWNKELLQEGNLIRPVKRKTRKGVVKKISKKDLKNDKNSQKVLKKPKNNNFPLQAKVIPESEVFSAKVSFISNSKKLDLFDEKRKYTDVEHAQREGRFRGFNSKDIPKKNSAILSASHYLGQTKLAVPAIDCEANHPFPKTGQLFSSNQTLVNLKAFWNASKHKRSTELSFLQRVVFDDIQHDYDNDVKEFLDDTSCKNNVILKDFIFNSLSLKKNLKSLNCKPFTVVFTHISCFKHDPGPDHLESPDRLKSVLECVFKLSGKRIALKSASSFAPLDDVLSCHEANYLSSLLTMCSLVENGTFKFISIDHPFNDTVISPQTRQAILYSTGAVTEAISYVMENKNSNAFVAVRPPGHHAESSVAMGFCFLNNVAIGAMYARRKYNLKRICIIDFDVHHGNGTQEILQNHKEFMYISVHREGIFPFTGEKDEQGKKGKVLNIPITTIRMFRESARKIQNAIRNYKPEFLILSAGFDGHHMDSYEHTLNLTDDDFSSFVNTILDSSKEFCKGRVISVLEGGYNSKFLGKSVAVHINDLANFCEAQRGGSSTSSKENEISDSTTK